MEVSSFVNQPSSMPLHPTLLTITISYPELGTVCIEKGLHELVTST